MSEIRFVPLGPAEYDRAKKVLDRASHPGFVGRELYYRCATDGKAVVAVIGDNKADVDVGVALVTKEKLHALSVVKVAQGLGVGSRLVSHVNAEWVNAIMDRVSWFEKRGYVSVGTAKVSLSGKMAMQLMRRDTARTSGAEESREAGGGDKGLPDASEFAEVVAPQGQEGRPDEPYNPEGKAAEDPENILNMGLRCIRRHLEAIESGGKVGRLLVMNQAQDVAGFVRALGAVSTKRRKKADEELGDKSLNELLTEAMKSPSLRPALMAAMGEKI